MEWILLWLICVAFSIAADSSGRVSKAVAAAFIVLISSVFIGFRVDVGTDYAGYFRRYNEMLNGRNLSNIFEPGFVALMQISMEVGVGFHGLMFLSALLTISCFYIAIFRFSSSMLFSTSVLFGLGIFGVATNQIRQAIAVGIVLVGMPFIWNRELAKWSLAVAMASLFHVTAVIVLPFYWLSRMKAPRLVLLGLLIFAILLFLAIQVREVLYRPIDFFAGPVGLGHYVDRIWQDAPRLNTGLRIFSYIAICIILLFFSRVFFHSNNMRLRVLTNMFYIGLIMSIGLSTFWALPRLSLYFMSASILLMPSLGGAVERGFGKNAVVFGLFVFWTALYFYQIIFAPGDLLPYQSIFWAGAR